jgi:hypothetical protein
MRRLLLGGLLLTPLALGCGQPGPVCHRTRGQVLFRDEPVAEAQVVFHPQHPIATDQKPVAFTDAQGRFELTTLQRNDGAPEGDYLITVELRDVRIVADEPVRDGPNLLPAKYADPKTTDLRYTVQRGENEIPPLILAP